MEYLPIEIEKLTPLEIFEPARMDNILAEIKKHAESIVTDTSTAAGRKEIASLAYKVAQSKTAIDTVGKEFVAGKKAELAKIDTERKKARDFLDSLKAKVRKPLTDWEEAEQQRITKLTSSIERINQAADTDGMKSHEIQEIINKLENFEIGENYMEFEALAKAAKKKSLESLKADFEKTIMLEKEREELDALRKEKEEREAKEREQRLAAELKEREEKIAKEAAEKERERIEREKADKLEAEKQRRAKAEHVEKINTEACRFIKGIYGTTEKQAMGIIRAIANGEVPHINIKY